MAYLILKQNDSNEDSDSGRYYEFNPENRKIFDKITHLLSKMKNGYRKTIENEIAALCAESLKSNRKLNSVLSVH